jgi:hypothetical protein
MSGEFVPETPSRLVKPSRMVFSLLASGVPIEGTAGD